MSKRSDSALLTINLGANKNEVVVPGSNGPVVFNRYGMDRAEQNKIRHLCVGAFEKNQAKNKYKAA